MTIDPTLLEAAVRKVLAALPAGEKPSASGDGVFDDMDAAVAAGSTFCHGDISSPK